MCADVENLDECKNYEVRSSRDWSGLTEFDCKFVGNFVPHVWQQQFSLTNNRQEVRESRWRSSYFALADTTIRPAN
jgi:hypothetical protein